MRRILIALVALAVPLAHAAAPEDVAKERRTVLERYLTASEAHAMVSANRSRVLFIDVRTQAEVSYVGIPEGLDANIPFLLIDFDHFDSKKRSYTLHRNPDFLRAIEARLKARGLDRDADIVLICRSGDRTTQAVNVLAAAGFTRVWNVVDGFEGDLANGRRNLNGWKNAGLPWTYRLEADQAWTPADAR
ncbi:rhodanese-like domain-containing protein [Methyloversatilis thermotolerans]|uniref:rhodanese-like domain-containing protein n=1 Tax=Methyloversatilis thermotolerans TaxID=1346290 RepID=UPI00036553B0|nr:rhodanese-like domain-containing protein [Methyloversatilis thermotolerans]